MSNLATLCSVDECNSTSAKKGMCDKHYRRMQRYGTLALVRQPPGGLVSCSGGYLSQLINGVTKLYHIIVAEKALGKPLPLGAEIHHVNEIKNDNRGENLVICPDQAYHMLIHARTRAFNACGNANWMKCVYCKQYDDISNGTTRATRGKTINTFYHKACAAKHAREKKNYKDLI